MPLKQNSAHAYSDQSNWSDTYLTDPMLIKALGPFSIDVACPPTMPWKTARKMLHADRFNGLTDSWGKGRAWMNPPYRGVDPWARRFAEHAYGICLLNGRSSSTKATQSIMKKATAMFIPRGRLFFYEQDGTRLEGRWFPSLLIGMTEFDAQRLACLPDHDFPGILMRIAR